MTNTLILASGSIYRRELLERLRLPFEVRTSQVDEAVLREEKPLDVAVRLAKSKAMAVAREWPGAWVIGSDQVAVCDGEVVGKPGDEARCIQQLRKASGKEVRFLTAVSLVRGESRSEEVHVDTTVVQFRQLQDAEIERYVRAEKPFDCAGGFKVEGLGISLFERVESQDPTGLIGLPLIWLCGALRRAGFAVP